MAETMTATPLRVSRLATKPILSTFMLRSSLEKLRPLERLVRTMSPSRTSTRRSRSRISRSTISAMVVLPDRDRPVNHSVNPRSSFISVPFDSLALSQESQFTCLLGLCSRGGRGIRRRELVAAVELSALRGRDGPVEERVFGLDHPPVETTAHLVEHAL